MDLLECIQKRATKLTLGMEHFSSEDRLRELGLFREEKAPDILIAAFQYLKKGCKKEGDRLFSRVCGDRIWRKSFKLKEGRFGFDIRKKFSIINVVRHWHRLPREVVDAPGDIQDWAGWGSEQPDGAVGVPVHGRELDWMAFKGSFQLKRFYGSMIL